MVVMLFTVMNDNHVQYSGNSMTETGNSTCTVPQPSSGFSPWLALVWIVWLSACCGLLLAGFPVILQHMLPGPVDDAMLFMTLAAAFFLAFVAPAWWHPARGRRQLILQSAAVLLTVCGPLVFIAAVSSRLYPLQPRAATRALIVLGVFSLFSYSLFTRSRSLYFMLQALLHAGLPLVAFLLRQMLSIRQPPEPMPLLQVFSIFYSVSDALAPGTIPGIHGHPLWLAGLALYGIGALLLLAVRPRDDCGKQTAG